MNDDFDQYEDSSENDDEANEVEEQVLIFRKGAGGDDGGDSWMVSYADMMTLIACFFILMMVFANYDAAVFQRKAELLAKYFQGENDISEDPMASIRSELETIANIDDRIVVKQHLEGAEIVINIEALFQIGSAKLNPEYKMVFDGVVTKIAEINKDVRIIVEGHTDDIPFISNLRFESNWQLSGARAATVAKLFDDKGFDRSHIAAVGFSDTRPAFPNRDANGKPIPENQRKNRRIVLKVLDRPKSTKPMGLGVIFNEETSPTTAPILDDSTQKTKTE